MGKCLMYTDSDNIEGGGTKKCASCFKKNVHDVCYIDLIKLHSASVANEHVFCCIPCAENGPPKLDKGKRLLKRASLLTRDQLNLFLRSNPIRVTSVENPKIDMKKTHLLEAMEAWDRVENQSEKKFKTRKTQSCDFRLLNVLFDDNFYEEFSILGANLDKHQLDTGGHKSFWVRVATAYADKNQFNSLQFASTVFKGIDTSHVVAHDGKKLKKNVERHS